MVFQWSTLGQWQWNMNDCCTPLRTLRSHVRTRSHKKPTLADILSSAKHGWESSLQTLPTAWVQPETSANGNQSRFYGVYLCSRMFRRTNIRSHHMQKHRKVETTSCRCPHGVVHTGREAGRTSTCSWGHAFIVSVSALFCVLAVSDLRQPDRKSLKKVEAWHWFDVPLIWHPISQTLLTNGITSLYTNSVHTSLIMDYLTGRPRPGAFATRQCVVTSPKSDWKLRLPLHLCPSPLTQGIHLY